MANDAKVKRRKECKRRIQKQALGPARPWPLRHLQSLQLFFHCMALREKNILQKKYTKKILIAMGSNLTSFISNCSKQSLRWVCSTVPALRQRIGVEESACQLHNMDAYGWLWMHYKSNPKGSNKVLWPKQSVSLVKPVKPRSEKSRFFCFCRAAQVSGKIVPGLLQARPLTPC